MRTTSPLQTQTVDRLRLQVYPDRRALGEAAGTDVAAEIVRLQAEKPNVRMIFAAAPSQNETLATLVAAEGIDWSRVTAFHMDEYLGLPADAEQKFSRYLREHLFDLVNPATVHLIEGGNDPA